LTIRARAGRTKLLHQRHEPQPAFDIAEACGVVSGKESAIKGVDEALLDGRMLGGSEPGEKDCAIAAVAARSNWQATSASLPAFLLHWIGTAKIAGVIIVIRHPWAATPPSRYRV